MKKPELTRRLAILACLVLLPTTSVPLAAGAASALPRSRRARAVDGAPLS